MPSCLTSIAKRTKKYVHSVASERNKAAKKVPTRTEHRIATDNRRSVARVDKIDVGRSHRPSIIAAAAIKAIPSAVAVKTAVIDRDSPLTNSI